MLDIDGSVPGGVKMLLRSRHFELVPPSTSYRAEPPLYRIRRITEVLLSHAHLVNMNGVDGVTVTQCSSPHAYFRTYTMWNVTDTGRLVASMDNESGGKPLRRSETLAGPITARLAVRQELQFVVAGDSSAGWAIAMAAHYEAFVRAHTGWSRKAVRPPSRFRMTDALTSLAPSANRLRSSLIFAKPHQRRYTNPRMILTLRSGECNKPNFTIGAHGAFEFAKAPIN